VKLATARATCARCGRGRCRKRGAVRRIRPEQNARYAVCRINLRSIEPIAMQNPNESRPYFGGQERDYTEGGPFGRPVRPYETMGLGAVPGASPPSQSSEPRGPVFRDRRHAGQILAERLARYRDRDDVLVLGLPRGGVPVAYEVAKALK